MFSRLTGMNGLAWRARARVIGRNGRIGSAWSGNLAYPTRTGKAFTGAGQMPAVLHATTPAEPPMCASFAVVPLDPNYSDESIPRQKLAAGVPISCAELSQAVGRPGR